MAVTHHDDLEFFAGDDWVISGVLLDLNGSPLDLTEASFQWVLIDPTGLQIPNVEGAVQINVIDPPTIGQVTISISSAITEPLAAGRYHDALRVFIGVRSTYWVGTVLVNSDPFSLIPSNQPQLQVVNLSAVPLLTAPIDMEKP